MNHVASLLVSHNLDILGISETWLNSQITDSSLNIFGYEIARSDSMCQRKKHGVAMYIRKGLNYQIVCSNVNNVIIVYLPRYKVYILTVYRPPSYDDAYDDVLIDFLLSFCVNKEVVLMGDFNLRSLKWHERDMLTLHITSTDAKFYDAFVSTGLSQVVKVSTFYPSGNVLDLCLVSDEYRVGSCEALPPLPNCGHCPIIISYVFQDLDLTTEQPRVPERLWTRGKYDLISRYLNEVDWELEFSGLSTDNMYQKFLQIVLPYIDRYIPLLNDSKKATVPWSINPPRRLERERSESWAQYKAIRRETDRNHTDTLTAWDRFRRCNDLVKSYALNSQITYEKCIVEQLKSNPKLFHSYIKHKKVSRPTVGPIRTPNGELTDDPQTMANCFVEAFSSVFVNGSPSNPSSHQASEKLLDVESISMQTILKILQNLDPNSGMGGDGIHSRFLKVLSSELAVPLTMIFNSSLQEKVLPSHWLRSIVVPIYKKSFRYDALNYRPVSLTSIPCKVLERAISQRLVEYLEENSLLDSNQFGFRSGHSTVDQLLLTYTEITSMVDSGMSVDLIFFDYAKAFDTVCHGILLTKLRYLGIHGHLLNWIEFFLTNRTMQVRVGGKLSYPKEVVSGVPQGSVLGPILFLIHVNYVTNRLSCKYKIFADDIKIYLSINNTGNSSHHAQNNIDTLVNTSSSWGLSLNAKKCVVMRFLPKSSSLPFVGQSPYTVQGTFLKFVATHSDLGVTVDRSLKFHSHVKAKVTTMNQLITNLLTSTVCREPDFMMNLYTAHVRPLLDYASPVWNTGYIEDLKLMERLQRRWTRSISGLENLPYEQRLRSLGLFSVQGRLLRADLLLVWKIFHCKCSISMDEMFITHSSAGA